jgi:glycosyltransferase involved in cell wall biosynthesis
VTVLTPAAPGYPGREEAEGVHVRRVRYFWPASAQRLAHGHGIPWNLRESWCARLNVPAFMLAFAWAIQRGARRADVVHCHWGVLGAVAVALRPLHRRPVVVTSHGSDLSTGIAPIRWVSRWALRRADAVTTPSPDYVELCAQIRGGAVDVHFTPHGVAPPGDWQAVCRMRGEARRPGGPHLVSVGRLIRERRHAALVRAMVALRQQHPEATLTLVGDGPEAAALRALAGGLGLGDAVRLPGAVAPADVPQFLLEADLYVSPTTVETFGLAAVEAAAHGLPVVTTRVGFPPELVGADGGWTVPPGDDEALQGALAEAAGDADERRRRAAAAFARVQAMGLTWTAAARKMIAVYESVTSARGGPS